MRAEIGSMMKRVPLLYSCEVVRELTQNLVEVLKRANLLRSGEYIEIFLFKNYNFNSIKNLSLVILWNYIYKSKFNFERYSAIKFKYYLKQNIDQLALLSPGQKSKCQAVIYVLESWKGAAANEHARHDVNND